MTHTFWQRLALTAFILVDGGVAASAATDACTDLQARLDAVSRSGSGNGDGFLASLFGGGFFGNGYSGGYGYSSAYRTLCVRASDGYYFPISFSTTPDHFNADAVTCQSMCPGSAVSLFVHHNPGEEVD